MNDDDDDSLNFKPGQILLCKIVRPAPGGYKVLIVSLPQFESVRAREELLPTNVTGFLPTQQRLEAGQEILARYVCMHQQTVLLAAVRTSENTSEAGAETEKQIDFVANRATDVFPRPFDKTSEKTLLMGEYDLHWLITDLETNMFTGVLKTSSSEKKSRSGMLLYKGRSPACVYVSQEIPDTPPTEDALRRAMEDLLLPDTQVTFYDLPPEVVLSLSGLFLGYAVNESKIVNAKAAFQAKCSFYEESDVTACLIIASSSSRFTCLVFFFKGKFMGSFVIETQTFSQDMDFVIDILNQSADAQIESNVLPLEMLPLGAPFGFNLRQYME